MQRVLVIGSPGAGKSTLATELARRTGLPLIHLDQHGWRSGWVDVPRQEMRQKVERLIAGESWIIDGNYGGTLSLRLTRADTVIDLAFPAWLCLYRILRRVARDSGRNRPDMAEGCPERLDFTFLAFVAGFPFSGRKRIDSKMKSFPGRYVKLHGPADVRRFLAKFGQHG